MNALDKLNVEWYASKPKLHSGHIVGHHEMVHVVRTVNSKLFKQNKSGPNYGESHIGLMWRPRAAFCVAMERPLSSSELILLK